MLHRRYDDQPDESARVVTTFREDFLPEDTPEASRPVTGGFPLLDADGNPDEHEAVLWRFADE